MPKPNKRALEVRELFVNANDSNRKLWRKREQQSYDFSLGEQLTEDEKNALEWYGMPTFTINRVTPIIETMKYFVTSNSPRWKAVGTDGSDSQMADIYTDVIDYAWYTSAGKHLFGHVIQDSLTKSKGYFHVYVDPNGDRGMGEVMFERVDPFHVWVAPTSTDPLERDAVFHLIKKDLQRRTLLNMLPDYTAKIKAATGERDGEYYSMRHWDSSESIQSEDIIQAISPTDGSEDDIIPYYEVYEPIRVKYYNIFVKRPISETELISLRESIKSSVAEFAREMEVRSLEQINSLQQALANGEIIKQRYDAEVEKIQKQASAAVTERENILLNRAKEETEKIDQRIVTEEEFKELEKVKEVKIDTAVPYYEKRIKKTCVVGDQLLYEFILPITHTPLVPIPYNHTGSPCPMSAVRPLIGKQQEINKSHQLMIHSANLSSNLRWLFAEGEIDEDEWEKRASAPSALLKYRPGMSNSGPREIMPQNINNAFFTIEHESKSDMEYMAGIQPPSMGISNSGSDETFRGFLAKDEYGTRRIRSWVSNIVEPALEHLGKVFHELAQDTYTVHKVLRIAQPNASGDVSEKQVEINIPIYNEKGEEIGKYNNYANSRYDIRIVSGSTLPINRWAILEEYKQYLQMGVIDDIAFIKETDIKDKDSVIERKSMLSQASSRIDDLENVIKERDGIIQTLTRQLVQAGIKDQVKDASMELDRSKTETKMLDKLFQERLRDELKLSRKEMNDQIQQLKDQIKQLIPTKEGKEANGKG